MKRKKVLAIALGVTMILPVNIFASPIEKFNDFPNDWSRAPLTYAVENGLINGANGKINGSGNLKRAEMAAIISRAFGSTEKAELGGFYDVKEGTWYYDDIAKAVQMGIFEGYNGELSPEKDITREEAFLVLARMFSMEGGKYSILENFSDGEKVSTWAKDAVASLVENGYISGSGRNVNPKNNITRAEFVKVMSNLASTYVSSPGVITEVGTGNVIIRTPGVTLKNLTIKGDLVLADGIGKENVVLDNVTIKGQLIVRGGSNASKISNSIIEKGIVLANNNEVTHLVIKDSKVTRVVAKTDFILDGNVDTVEVSNQASVVVKSGEINNIIIVKNSDNSKVTVNEGAVVSKIKVDANDVQIGGAGKIYNIEKDNNSTVVKASNPNKENSPSKSENISSGGSSKGNNGNTSNNGNINNNGNASNNGSTNNSGSTSNNGNGNTGEEVINNKPGDFLKLEETKVIDLGWVQYTVISFKEGTIDDYEIFVNGKEVEVSKVDDEGTIVKWEIESLGEFELKLEKSGKIQTINLGRR